ncbi:MAG TPA: IS630 family transposase, partial [Selenomonas sp.]|nr:IS630 family transposase [Selenomonas sp.]
MITSITLTDNDRKYLQTLIRQRTMQAQIIDRAKILIYKEQGNANGAIAERLDVHIN